MQTLTVGPAPTTAEVGFARSEEFLAPIENDGRRVGAVVFGTRAKPYKVNLLGLGRGSFTSWVDAVAFIDTLDLDGLA